MHILDKDIWQEIFDSLSRHKLRSLLTAFGVFWGIFMLVNLIGMGKGLENGFIGSFGSAANSIFFWSGRPTSIAYKGMDVGRRIQIRDSDLEVLRSRFSNIKFFAPGNGFGEQITSRGNKTESFTVHGVSEFEDEVRNYEVLQGRFINHLDIDQNRKIAIIGDRVQEVLFSQDEDPIGQRINVKGIPLLVVGVIAPKGTSQWQQQDRSKVFLPRSTLKKLTSQGDVIHWLNLIPKEGYKAGPIQQEILKILKERHKVHPKDEGVIGTFNAQAEFDKWNSFFIAISGFSWIVAIGTIIAGVVGVGNIMLITVKERTKEIGIRKAIGATPQNIVFTIVQESMALTFVAGYFGLVAGVFAVEGVAAIVASAGPNQTFSNPEVEFSTAITALIVLLIAGALASLLPARKAAGVDPVIALQDE